ncbi:MAG: hypothetical protein ACKOC0_09245 [Cytophagales bacterium]
MNYNSLTEYFYKLYNRCLALMFPPVAGFLYLYQLVLNNTIKPSVAEVATTDVIVVAFPTTALVGLTIVHWLCAKSIKRYASELSLGIRLDHYAKIATIRAVAAVGASLLMALGLFLTQHPYFTVYLSVLVVWIVLYWPTPGKIARDYKLKGDEKHMLLTKGEDFK